mgnify:CR=1 FL=1|tara:strand:+ start:738 stop:950 length:213 start_codon:yes stop_codon:yes gene_type:complete
MNPAAIDFARQKAADIRWQNEISGESENARLDREMQERYQHAWPGPGEKALYGKVDDTLAGKINDRRFIM